MQLIENPLFNIIIPDKGYKIINKTNGKCYNKVILGRNDSVENYTEEIDDKYINPEILVEFDNLKEMINMTNEYNELTIDLLLLTIDELYISIEPILSSVPMTLEESNNINMSKFIDFYVMIVKRGLKDINEIPERFKEDVKCKLI